MMYQYTTVINFNWIRDVDLKPVNNKKISFQLSKIKKKFSTDRIINLYFF